MKFFFIVIAVLIVSAVVVLPTYALQTDKKPGSHKEFCFKNHLNLTDQQLAKMKELRNRFRADTRDLRYDLKIKRVEMRKLFTDPKTDDETLLAKQKEISGLRQQLSEKKAQSGARFSHRSRLQNWIRCLTDTMRGGHTIVTT